MNKVDLHYHTFTTEHKYVRNLYIHEPARLTAYKEINDFYLEQFGLGLDFNSISIPPKYFTNIPIIDKSKFTLFMLKFPHLIKKISYE